LDQPLEIVLHGLASVAWDSEVELMILRPTHVVEALKRFKSGALDADAIERWASAIEGRDDIGLDHGNSVLLKAVIFDLANPTLQGKLSDEVADRWIERLNAV